MDMSKILRILAILAVVQVALVVIMNLGGGSGLQGQAANAALLDFDQAQIDRVLIRGPDDAAVTLSKQGGKWQTPDGFPADQGKMDGLLAKLNTLKHGLPVATSSSALERFKVDADGFERHIILQQADEDVAELYIGSGAGARQSHVRGGEDEAVYTAEVAVYDAPATASEWQDKGLLQLQLADVSAVEMGDFKLQLAPESGQDSSATIWKADNLPAGKLLNQQAINNGLAPLLSLRFDEVLGKEAKPEYALDSPALSLRLVHKDGSREYRFGKLKDKDEYVLKVSDRPEYLQVAGFAMKPLLEGIGKEQWLLDETPPLSSEETPSQPFTDQGKE